VFHNKSEQETDQDSRWNYLSMDWEDTKDAMEMLKRKIRAAARKPGEPPPDWDEIFKSYDADGNGELDLEEFTRVVRPPFIPYHRAQHTV
jgi:hypothetical protein